MYNFGSFAGLIWRPHHDQFAIDFGRGEQLTLLLFALRVCFGSHFHCKSRLRSAPKPCFLHHSVKPGRVGLRGQSQGACCAGEALGIFTEALKWLCGASEEAQDRLWGASAQALERLWGGSEEAPERL